MPVLPTTSTRRRPSRARGAATPARSARRLLPTASNACRPRREIGAGSPHSLRADACASPGPCARRVPAPLGIRATLANLACPATRPAASRYARSGLGRPMPLRMPIRRRPRGRGHVCGGGLQDSTILPARDRPSLHSSCAIASVAERPRSHVSRMHWLGTAAGKCVGSSPCSSSERARTRRRGHGAHRFHRAGRRSQSRVRDRSSDRCARGAGRARQELR